MRKDKFKDVKLYRQAKIGERNRYYGESSSKYPRRFWSLEEDNLVLGSSLSDRELSDKLKRSVKAIQHRRHRLKYGR